MKTCPKCNKPHDNIFGGVVIVEKDGARLTVCGKCAERLKRAGWREVARQK